MLTKDDEGGRWFRQMLTIDDEGGGGSGKCWPLLTMGLKTRKFGCCNMWTAPNACNGVGVIFFLHRTPTKPPTTPSQSTEYANQNTNYVFFPYLLQLTCWNKYVNFTPQYCFKCCFVANQGSASLITLWKQSLMLWPFAVHQESVMHLICTGHHSRHSLHCTSPCPALPAAKTIDIFNDWSIEKSKVRNY